jgi:hypothetical protein
MTSKLKCPICGGDIQYNDGYSTYDCKNNPANHNASEEIWKALIQSRQQLKMLEPIVASLQGRADINAEVARDSNELVVQWYEKYEQSQKDLEIARQALDKADRFFEGTIGLYQSEMMAIIKTALEQIEHKE